MTITKKNGQQDTSNAGTDNSSDKPTRKMPKLKKVSDFGEKWKGQSPTDIFPERVRDDFERFTDKDMVETGMPLALYGFLKMKGNYEGKDHDFALICCGPVDDPNNIFTVVSSGMVVLKKLDRIAEKGGFPVAGKFVREKNYYDLVDC